MADNPLWPWFFVILVLDLAFTAMRASLVNARLPYLLNLREKNPGMANRALKLLETPSLRIALRSAGVILHFVLAGLIFSLAVSLVGKTPEPWVVLVGMILAALLSLAVEFLVEGGVVRNSEEWAMRAALFGRLVVFVLSPFSWLLERFYPSVHDNPRSIGPVTEDELKTWVEEGQAQGTLEQDEREMIYSIFHFSETLCREIMVPRIDVFALEADVSLTEAIQEVNRSQHSRVPVYDDVIDNILGVLYAKDLLGARLENGEATTVRGLMRPAYFVPEAKRVGDLMKEMQAQGNHIAIVIDEYGGMAGLVTLEDIVEEIVGEIRDEYDQSEELVQQEITPDEFVFQGRVDLDDVNEVLGTHLTKEIADTLGGYIYGEVGRIPVEGENVKLEDWTLTVEKVTGRRIRLVRARRWEKNIETEDEHGTE